MEPIMYVFLNKSLHMSTGKAAAQAAHAAVEAVFKSESKIVERWRKVGGHYTKVVLVVSDTTQMLVVERYLQERGFKTALIIDEGVTEGTYFVPTAMGVEVVDKDDLHTQMTFSRFKLYSDKKRLLW